jgi:ribonucleoside-diphosphate reductase alpha chain
MLICAYTWNSKHGVVVRMQTAFQEYTDNAVSKTVNLPAETSRRALTRIYTQAHRLGLKGITVYRDNSHQKQPFCTGEAGIKLINEKFGLDQS